MSSSWNCVGRRCRQGSEVVLGYVGRLSPEKNLRLLKRVDEALRAAGERNYRFAIVGHGAESDWLRKSIGKAYLPGVLLGRDLARAYADMDVFLFPSRTDTYGNAVWEASASGVPAVVTDSEGPQYIVRDGETGLVIGSDDGFVRRVLALYRDEALRRRMGANAREAALRQSWESILDRLYSEAYEAAVAA